jgi:aminopeptidase YwaD
VRVLASIDDIGRPGVRGSVALITGELASEPMTPKTFPFYGSDAHAKIISALENARPAVVIAVTGKYPELCGALDPFPWVEDGDFQIPAASIRPEEAGPLLAAEGHPASVTIEAHRIPSRAHNVIGRRGPPGRRITVCAHIDTKPDTPGAVDNATGVAALVLLGDLLSLEQLPIEVELLAVNGEDHFAAPGEIAWLEANRDTLDEIELFINVDGAGYRQGGTAYSLYNVGDVDADRIRTGFSGIEDLVEGPPWFQSDHAILAMQGRPAMAFTTEFVQEMLADLFHSEEDTVEQVDPDRIVSLAQALRDLTVRWPSGARRAK